MGKIKRVLGLKNKKSNNKKLIIYIIIAYIISLSIRLLLYYQISNNNDFFYNGYIIPLWTPDAGLYGYYTKQLLQGVSYPFISEYTPAYLLYGIIRLTGINLNTALFFTPAFLSSLIVIPIILIANSYKLVKFGFYGAIIGSLMTSYYYRTHLGYYDTDILNAFFPLMAIFFLIKFSINKKLIDALIASSVLTIFNFWYHSSISIIIATIFIFIIYTIIYERKSIYAYQTIFLLSISILPLAFIYKILILITLCILFYSLNKYQKINYKVYILTLFIIFLGFISLSDTTQYYKRVNSYINKTSSIIVKNSQNREIKFKSDLDGVIEAKNINLSEMVHRVSGAMPFFILAIIGYLALLIRFKSMLLTLPLIGIAFLSMIAGLRFTIYGVTILSFSMVFGVYIVFKNILITWGEFSKKVLNIATAIFLTIVSIFALMTIINYNKEIKPVFFSSTEDIKTLDKFKRELDKDDFILSWWEYGWPLWYYLNNKNTLLDNGKHQQDNFIISKMLLSNNQNFVRNSSIFFVEKYIEGRKKGFDKVMNYFLKNYSLTYLNKLNNSSFKLPKSNRKVYILLHKNMLYTLSNIEMYSNLDLKTGKSYNSSFIDRGYLSKKYNSSQKLLKTTTQLSIDIEHGRIISTNPNENADIREITIKNGSSIKFKKSYNTPNNIYVVIYDKNMLITNKKLYNSFLIQALILNNYNHNLFNEVARDKNLLILKVKNE